MTAELFREEVLLARRAQWLGGISLAQPVRLWVLTAFAASAALAVILFLSLGSYTRRSTVTGQLVPSKGLATVLAPAAGVISRVEVAEGGWVQAGQTLAVVTVPRVTVASGDTHIALEQQLLRRRDGLQAGFGAKQALLNAQSAGSRAQLAAAKRELLQIEAKIVTQQEQIRIAHETLDRLRQLEDERYVSLLQIKQQESAALAQVGQMQLLQRQAISTRRLIAQLQQALHELPGQRQDSEAEFQRDLAQLEQEQVENQARGEMVITALWRAWYLRNWPSRAAR